MRYRTAHAVVLAALLGISLAPPAHAGAPPSRALPALVDLLRGLWLGDGYGHGGGGHHHHRLPHPDPPDGSGLCPHG